MNRVIKFVPNLLSLLNALFGGLAIYSISAGIEHLPIAIALLLFGSIPCDVFDGLAARLLHAKSEIGVDLDSLADTISFGVSPAIMAAMALEKAGFFFPPLALIVIPFSVYRLAKFNHDVRQTESFLGLPTPASALFLCGWATILAERDLTNQVPPVIILLILCLLLVSEMPMFGVKTFGRWRLSQKTLLVITACAAIISVVLWGYALLALWVCIYIVVNFSHHLSNKVVQKPGETNTGENDR